jgi:hypothetical protein
MSTGHIILCTYFSINIIMAIISLTAIQNIRDRYWANGKDYPLTLSVSIFVEPRLFITIVTVLLFAIPLGFLHILFNLRHPKIIPKQLHALRNFLDHLLLMCLSLPIGLLMGIKWFFNQKKEKIMNNKNPWR